MKILKRACFILMAAVFLLSGCHITADAASEPEFSGTRTVVFTADLSDVENFINGGRAALDLMLRASKPDWAEFRLATAGRDLEFKLSFSFVSYDDYCAKTSEFLTRTASVLYHTENGLFLLESHEPIALLGFLEAPLNAQGAFSERQMAEIFKVSQNALVIGGEEYFFDGKVRIIPEGHEPRRFNYLRVETECDENGEYTRRIVAEPDSADEESMNALKREFEKIGTVTMDEYDETRLTLEFSACNDKDLVNKTMQCLGVSVAITENEVFINSETVGVSRDEYFDINALMTKYGTFQYIYHYPQYYTNLTTDSEDLVIQENSVSAEDTELVSFSYERGFRFDRMDVITDFSDVFGSVTCCVRFIARSDLAVQFHDALKTAFSERLIDGVTLNIYDKSGNRYYEFRFKAWYMSDIDEFFKNVLGSSSYLEIDDSFLPFGTSTANGKIKTKEPVEGMLPPKEISAIYKFRSEKGFEMLTRRLDKTTLPDGSVQFSISNGKTLALEYRRMNLLKIGICAAILVAILTVVVWFFKFLLKKRKQKRSHKQKTFEVPAPSVQTDEPAVLSAPQAEKTSENPVCPQCGATLSGGNRFCKHCGASLTR